MSQSSEESTIITSVFSQGEVEDVTTTPRKEEIVKSQTLVLIHPCLKLDSGDTTVNCYIPKKNSPGKAFVVGINRDPDQPVHVNINPSDVSGIPQDLNTIREMSGHKSSQVNSNNKTMACVHSLSIEKIQGKTRPESNCFKPIDLIATRKEINKVFETGNGVNLELPCSMILVGSYKRSDDGDTWSSDNFYAKICDKGILFRMSHSVTPSLVIQLVIPHSLIIKTQAFFSDTVSFVALQIDSEIAKWARDKLGIIQGNNKGWFDPFAGAQSERYIVFVADKCLDSPMEVLRKIYERNLLELGYENAQIFCKDIGLESESDPFELEDCTTTPFPVETAVSKPATPHSPSPPDPPAKLSTNNNSAPTLRPPLTSVITRVNSGQLPPAKLPNNINSTSTPETSIPKPSNAYNPTQGSKIVLKWPPGQAKAMTLLQRDICTLTGEQFLNDEIIDFWLSYVINKLLSPVDRERTHLFSIHFYSRLTQMPKKRNCPGVEQVSELDKLSAAEKRHRRVKKWTKNVDIFSKDYVIIPIIDNCHWYVAIICFPGVNGPHWMGDGTPILDWKNVVKINGRPTYQPPPGMPKQDSTIPPRPKYKVYTTTTTNSIGATNLPASNDLHNNKKTDSPITRKEERDEADEDPNENFLFEDYFSTDNESTPLKYGSPISGHSEDLNMRQPNKDSDMTNNQGFVSTKKEECDDGVEPMEFDPPDDPLESRTDFRVQQPCIFLFDSLSGSPRSRVFNTLRDYLKEEFKEKKGEVRSFSSVDVPGFMPNVPQQKNLCDCGIYVLQYVEQFFSNPFQTFCLPITDLKKWFPELKTKRREIYDTIHDLVKSEDEEKLKLMPKFETPPTTVTTICTPSTSTFRLSTDW